jgi:hypothetical protein
MTSIINNYDRYVWSADRALSHAAHVLRGESFIHYLQLIEVNKALGGGLPLLVHRLIIQ